MYLLAISEAFASINTSGCCVDGGMRSHFIRVTYCVGGVAFIFNALIARSPGTVDGGGIDCVSSL